MKAYIELSWPEENNPADQDEFHCMIIPPKGMTLAQFAKKDVALARLLEHGLKAMVDRVNAVAGPPAYSSAEIIE